MTKNPQFLPATILVNPYFSKNIYTVLAGIPVGICQMPWDVFSQHYFPIDVRSGQLFWLQWCFLNQISSVLSANFLTYMNTSTVENNQMICKLYSKSHLPTFHLSDLMMLPQKIFGIFKCFSFSFFLKKVVYLLNYVHLYVIIKCKIYSFIEYLSIQYVAHYYSTSQQSKLPTKEIEG